MEFAKVLEGGLVEIVMCDDGDQEKKIRLETGGFLPFKKATQPADLPGKVFVESYVVENGMLKQCWNPEIDKDEINARIQALKDELSSTDYQVIKCYESSLIGAALPYDINQLHTSRQKIRDEINALEMQLQ